MSDGLGREEDEVALPVLERRTVRREDHVELLCTTHPTWSEATATSAHQPWLMLPGMVMAGGSKRVLLLLLPTFCVF